MDKLEPKYRGSYYDPVDEIICPTCKRCIGSVHKDYINADGEYEHLYDFPDGDSCPYCGQALDWSAYKSE